MDIRTFYKKSGQILIIGFPIYFLLMLLINYKLRPAVPVADQLIGLMILFFVLNMCLGLFYLLLFKHWVWKFFLLSGLVFVVGSEAIYHIRAALLDYVRADPSRVSTVSINTQFYWKLFNKYLGVLLMSAALAFHVKSQHNVRRRYEEEQKRLQKELEAKNYEIAFLTAQINQHFLYNYLNKVVQECTAVLPQVAQSLRKLADLLRYSLRVAASGVHRVVVDHELRALQMYVSLERYRYGKCYVELRVEGSPCGQKIPPGTLVALTENAFKYGVVQNPACPVQILLQLYEEEIRFSCRNHIDRAKRRGEQTGLGLRNIMHRLELLFPGAHQFEAREVDRDVFQVDLTIMQD